MTGLPRLREQVALKVAGLYGRSVSAEAEVTIVPGATEAIFCAVQALIGPGDEAIVLDPCYDSYEPAVALAGGRCVHVPLVLPDYAVDWQRLGRCHYPTNSADLSQLAAQPHRGIALQGGSRPVGRADP